MKNKSGLMLTILLFLFGACSDTDVVGPKGDPSNLQVNIEVPDDNSGTVVITASAENVVEYTFSLGDGSPEVSNSTGQLLHIYSSSGVYRVEVRAFGSNERYLKKVYDITVIIDEEAGFNPDGYTTPLTYPGMTLLWQDEFNGSALSTSSWNYQIGDGCPDICGWGNNELEYYRMENTAVADGYLTIEAKEEDFGGRSYTSSRLTTKDKFEFRYGRVDIRAILPRGQGIWPALWMLGSNIDAAGWPYCGEVDIMEMIGGSGRENEVHGTTHWQSSTGYLYEGEGSKLSSGTYNDQFHVFTLIWDASSIKWLVDDVQFREFDITPADRDEFQQEFFLLFNVAVGGNWPGNPNATTSFPQQMIVDYIRVFQND